MNQFFQNNLIIIILILLCFILALMSFIVFILYKLFNKSQNEKNSQSHINSDLNNEATKNNSISLTAAKILAESKLDIVEKFYCFHHAEAPSVGSCLICEEVFCENCLVEHEGMHFCREHFKIFANNKWVQITDEKTIPIRPEDGMYIWNFKREIWRTKTIPTFVLTHYKINIDEDFIESYVQLNVRESDSAKLSLDIEVFKAGK